ncbi:hypothetical protein [Paenisporosarcina cavernae]|uniref:Lipoprotein n=1 Tax=Paenisporosarcina cavernae TaxID=2320858 RepID=A0A385YP82_9BACL|nr:hypothetical protein [Paenisporosarcina cavernae]AYC28495.1 hypothetical protein D3873_00905 [Paenisporosarcina cavernae]
MGKSKSTRRISLIVVCCCSGLLLAACNSKEPEIQLEVHVSPISPNEFNKLELGDRIINPTIEDFRQLTFRFHMEHSNAIDHRTIRMFDEWSNTLYSIGGQHRDWGSTSSSQDNENENFAKYTHDVVFYSRDVSEEELKNAFADATIYISWSDSQKHFQERTYSIGENLTFEQETKQK